MHTGLGTQKVRLNSPPPSISDIGDSQWVCGVCDVVHMQHGVHMAGVHGVRCELLIVREEYVSFSEAPSCKWVLLLMLSLNCS